MKRTVFIGIVLLLALLSACRTPTREAKRMAARAVALAETHPDSTIRLVDSIFRIEANLKEGLRMDLALLQGEALFGEAPLDDDDFEDTAYRVPTTPELERAAAYYAHKKQYAKAAHAALYSGFVQQHYGEKETAMQSFKDAEQYGLLANDSLTVARAEYWMGKNLLYEGMEQEALRVLKSAELCFRNDFEGKALTENLLAICYMMQEDHKTVETYLQQSITYAKKGLSSKVKRKILNNHAVFYRQQGNYVKSLACLRNMAEEPDLKIADSVLLCLNMGKTFMAMGQMDSAAFYFHQLVTRLPNAEVKEETKVSAYDILANYADLQGNAFEALQYRSQREIILSGIMKKRQEQTIYRIQQQYDFETMRNDMSQRIIRRQRVIAILSMMVAAALMILTYSQIRLAKMRKQEAEAKARLLHFMQQNEELLKRQRLNEEIRSDLLLRQSEKEIAYKELESEIHAYKEAYHEYAKKYSEVKVKELETVIRLAVYLKNNGDKASLDTLKRAVFNSKTSWEAIVMVFDAIYPDVRESVDKQHPELTEMERKDFILSFFKASRNDEADLLETTIYTVDKLRNNVRKKLSSTSV